MSLIWARAGSKSLGHLSHHFTRRFSPAPGARALIDFTTTSLITKKSSGTTPPSCRYPTVVVAASPPPQQFASVRFFAAPASAKKAQEKEVKVTRMNGEITTPYVRLVSDEGHGIVTRTEALHRAKTLDLDLVEVDCKAEPPVCKIMDFHKEKYKKGARDKGLAKTKAEASVRKGDCKKVHFSGKIEQKDLQMKAETVRRLMEHGYRVKIVAEAGKKSETSDVEKEDLGSVLDRLYNLIEDISAVESPPRVEKKIAYVIVRHAKFGTKKNPAKKTSKTDKSEKGIEIQVDSTPTAECHGAKLILEPSTPTNHGLETLGNFDTNSLSEGSGRMKTHHLKIPVTSGVNLKTDQRYTGYSPAVDTTKPSHDSRTDQRDRSVSNDPSTVRVEPSPALSNRYKRSDTNTRLNGGRIPPPPSFDRSQNRHQLDMQRQPLPDHPNSRGNFPSQFPPENNQKHGSLDSKNRYSIPHGPSVAPSYFGAFSASKTVAFSDEQKKQSDVNNDNKENSSFKSTLNLPKSKGESPRQESKTGREWGIFSR